MLIAIRVLHLPPIMSCGSKELLIRATYGLAFGFRSDLLSK